MNSNAEICIVGAGLSGLYLAYLLKKKGVDCHILEASNRIGGRIQTEKGALETPLEIGATWFSDLHEHLLALIDELGLNKFPQYSKGISLFQTKSFEPAQRFYVPESDQPSYRLKDGTSALIAALVEKLDKNKIKFNTKVNSVKEIDNQIQLNTTNNRAIIANKVVFCMPPQLISSQISFSPQIPIHDLLQTVQTWMAGSIKFTLEYAQSFWRKKGYSGMLYSHAGIVTEMYDHTNFEETKFGFTGFLNPGAANYSQEVRKEFVLKQLIELLGEEAGNPTSYFDKIWKDEFILESSPIIQRPHQNNGHPLLQDAYFLNKIFFCGTETSPVHSGYMEGAIISAKHVFNELEK